MSEKREPGIQDEEHVGESPRLNLGAAVAALSNGGLLSKGPAAPMVVDLPAGARAPDTESPPMMESSQSDRRDQRKENGSGEV